MDSDKKIRRLPVKNFDAALRIYYSMDYIGNKEIGEIFGTTTPSTIYKLKKPVLQAEKENDVLIVVPYHINTKLAYRVWGIDIQDIEKSRRKLQDLQLTS